MNQNEATLETTVNISSEEIQNQIQHLAEIFAEKEKAKREQRARKIAQWKAAKGIKD